MDSEAVQKAFESLCCTKKTSVQYFDTREYEEPNGPLDEQQTLERIQELQSLLKPASAIRAMEAETEAPLFILMTASGDSSYKDHPLKMSTTVMRELVDAGIFLPRLFAVYHETQAHFSHHVEYDEEKDIPIALHVYLRVPRIGKIINLAMRICLPSLTTIALLTARVPGNVASLRARCIRQSSLIQQHPLHLLNFVLELRMVYFEDWVGQLWNEVGRLERKTGIGWRWSTDEDTVRAKGLESEEYSSLLQDLHSVGVELRLAQTTIRFAADLGAGFKNAMQRLEYLRKETNGGQVKKRVRVTWEDQVDFNETILRTTWNKFSELTDRVQAQITVTYSLIAQKGNEQNIQIAKLTAKDSQIMKSITVLTLTFLPSTMLASLWDAGIFTLDADTSWRVYLGTTCALTAFVFALWFLYLWVNRTRSPIPIITDVGKEKKWEKTEDV